MEDKGVWKTKGKYRLPKCLCPPELEAEPEAQAVSLPWQSTQGMVLVTVLIPMAGEMAP